MRPRLPPSFRTRPVRTKLLVLLSVPAGLFAAGCVSNRGVFHTTEFYDVVLSPAKRTDTKDSLTLVSISRTGRVSVRDSRGTIWRARKGEQFVNALGHGSEYTLKSVSPQTGVVVLQGTMRLYY
jgi:hypothetical protein